MSVEENEPINKIKISTGDNEPLAFGNIQFVENRTCKECGNEYPVYSRNDIEADFCINCDNNRVQKDMQKRYEETERQRPNRLMKEFSFVPDEIKSQSFKTFKPETTEEHQALQQVLHFVKSFPNDQTLVLAGSVGTGKTHLAYSAAREIIKKGYVVIFVTVPELLESIRSTFNNSGLSETEVKRIYKEADLLILDDIGAEYIKDYGNGSWAAEIIFDIVNARTTKATIYTTNLAGKDIEDHYGGIQGKRIVSRMKKNSTAIKLTGKDRRTSEW
ncbi:TPA: ATP-binding protein [Listeria monocytogenes]|nr:ATP-binding protein [Listeria monocytogenes]